MKLPLLSYRLCSATRLAVTLATTVFYAWNPAAAQDTRQETNLDPLVELLGQMDDASFQRDVLQGMREGLRGRKHVQMPKAWPHVYDKLSASSNRQVREEARLLALMFGDPRVLATLRETMMNAQAHVDQRTNALDALVQRRVANLAGDLHKLLDDRPLRRPALRALAAFSDPGTPGIVLDKFQRFSVDERRDAIATLAARPEYALALLDAVAEGKVDRREISAFTARQIQNLGDSRVLSRIQEVWGEVKQTSQGKEQQIAKYKKMLTPKFLKKADLRQGRLVYSKTCMNCHRLFGEGGQIGPDLTGSNRNNLDYILENVIDPNAVIGKDYQLTNIITIDGRVISGIIVQQTDRRLTIQTLNERLVVATDDIDEITAAEVSMMPQGQLDELTKEQVRDLIAYLSGTVQQPPLAPESDSSDPASR